MRVMLREAHEAKVTAQPEIVTYVAAIRWPDGDTKQGSFRMDRTLYAGMQEKQGDKCPSWEHIVLQMMSQTIEKLLSKRERAEEDRKIIILPK